MTLQHTITVTCIALLWQSVSVAAVFDPCTSAIIGSPQSVTAVVREHAWAAGVAGAFQSSCSDLMAELDAKHPAWAELLRATSSVQLANSGTMTQLPSWTLTALASEARTEVSVARNETLAASLAPACMATSCSTRQALAADALAGSLRLRDEPGWARVGNAEADTVLTFPNDHLLHDGASDEWIYFVTSGLARDSETKDLVPFSAVLLMDFHLPGPVTTLSEAPNVGLGGQTPGQSSRARQRILDVRVGVDLGGESCAAHTTAGAALHGPAAPITVGVLPSALIPEAAELTDSKSVYVVATGPLEEALTTSASSMVAMDPVTLNQLHVIGRDIDTGVSFGFVAERTIPSVILHGDNGTGIIGQSDTGNGYKYYSVPRYTVSGNLTALDCKGNLRSLEVQEALGWLDHQWGTIALPYTAAQREEQALYVRLGGEVPLVDRGFGIVGVEVWFAFQLTDVAHGMPQLLQGGVVTGNIVELAAFGTLVNLPFNGRVGLANGTSSTVHGTINATSTTLCSAEMAKAGQCDPTNPPAGQTVYCTGFSVELPSLGVSGDSRMILSSVSPDHSMRFATGQPFWEGGALIRCAGCADSDPLSGFAFVEQIGWDVNGTRDILTMAGVASPDDDQVHAADKDYNFATS